MKGGVATIPEHRLGVRGLPDACRFPARPTRRASVSRAASIPRCSTSCVYTAKDPYVLGVGMAAMRDVVSFFRYARRTRPARANPIFGLVPHVIAMGNSQSGRFAKAFLNLGFNEDEHGRIVWDGLNARIAGMLGSFNTRFAQPGDIAELYMPGAEGPLWWGDYDDNVRGRPAWGLLHRCSATKTCPKITETYGGPEVWYSRGTRRHRRDDGQGRPAAARQRPPLLPRRHARTAAAWAGSSSGHASDDPERAREQSESRARDRSRALRRAGRLGREGHAAAAERVSARQRRDARAGHLCRDGLAEYSQRAEAGRRRQLGCSTTTTARNIATTTAPASSTNVPPPMKRVIPTLVPKVDADGNDVAGVKSLLFRVPLGTYTGWNPIGSGVLKGRERSLAGGYIPFAKTKAERLASGDPRLSIEERYPSLQAYVAAATREAAALVADRLLLPDDAARLLKQVVDDMQRVNCYPRVDLHATRARR